METKEIITIVKLIWNIGINAVIIVSMFYHASNRWDDAPYLKRLIWMITPISAVACVLYPDFWTYAMRDTLIAGFFCYYIIIKKMVL